ncbi:class E sortase [Nonomuraea sp. PA05]|uniref:class E sortase n=1 Tax=Nonomuraea sp. PA05 TaxID=2604466 RepID=UPI0011DA56F4|nr:class E sortase [Nonomuraea sp. PA05]TYB51121.1 class E sortase [Nonomuraea sp. PA05]
MPAYLVYGKPLEVGSAQRELDRTLEAQWQAPPPDAQPAEQTPSPLPPVAGQPASRLHTPTLGLKWVVLEGVSERELRKGPAHYPGTAQPGETGNFAVAGHRLRGVFWDLDRLRPGDPVVVETRTGWYVYRVTGSRVVRPTQSEVLSPDPHRPGAAPTAAVMTLTTCHPKLRNDRRLIVHATLTRATAKPAGLTSWSREAEAAGPPGAVT